MKPWQWLRASALLALMAIGWAGCTDNVTYSYFTIDVKLDGNTIDMGLLSHFASCGMYVEGAVTDFHDLGCQAGRESVDQGLGPVNWSTTATGKVHFSVIVQDANHTTIASGVSTDYEIDVGKTTQASLVVGATSGIPDASTALDASTKDAATDGRSADAASD